MWKDTSPAAERKKERKVVQGEEGTALSWLAPPFFARTVITRSLFGSILLVMWPCWCVTHVSLVPVLAFVLHNVWQRRCVAVAVRASPLLPPPTSLAHFPCFVLLSSLG